MDALDPNSTNRIRDGLNFCLPNNIYAHEYLLRTPVALPFNTSAAFSSLLYGVHKPNGQHSPMVVGPPPSGGVHGWQ